MTLALASFVCPMADPDLVIVVRRLPDDVDGTPRYAANEIHSPKQLFIGITSDLAIRLLIDDHLEPPILLTPAKGGA